MLSTFNSTAIRVLHSKRIKVKLSQERPRLSSQPCIVVRSIQLLARMESYLVSKHSRHHPSAAMLQNSQASDSVTSAHALHRHLYISQAQHQYLHSPMRDHS